MLKKVWEKGVGFRLRYHYAVTSWAVSLRYLAARYSCQLHRSRRSAFPQKGFSTAPTPSTTFIGLQSFFDTHSYFVEPEVAVTHGGDFEAAHFPGIFDGVNIGFAAFIDDLVPDFFSVGVGIDHHGR